MLQIYNSETQRKEVFQPLRPPEVSLYVCGMTVYDYCHLGHARMLVTFDMVARYLKYSGFKLKYIRNITDIDDKIIHRAAEQGESYAVFSERFIEAMQEDCAALNMISPAQEPRATAYIAEMQAMISTLIQKGLAYVGTRGDVLYDVSKKTDYGRLSKRHLEDLRAGARVAIDAEKDDPFDFVLWKLAKPGEPAWPSPWGEGRPGWHIECSAMAAKCLHTQIDLHGGGADLLFPHHENEIAQSEGVSGQKFVQIWMHTGFLQINAEKMSKSLGNFLTIREALKTWPAEVLRYFFLSSHYRSPLNYADDQLEQAKQALTRLYTALRDLPLGVAPAAHPLRQAFIAAMDDDFHTPGALAVLFEVVREIHRCENFEEKAGLGALLKELAGILGILQENPEVFFQKPQEDDADIEALIVERNQARLHRNFAEADRLRQVLADRGVILEDTKEGSTWRRL